MTRFRSDDDDESVLPDGGTVRVPMMLRDGTLVEVEDWQRDVILAARAADAADAARRFGLSDALDLHKPGQRFCVDAAARAHVEEVYQDEKRKLQDAWRQPVGDAAPPPIESRANMTDARSVPRTMSLADAQAIRDAAYEQSVRELTEAWKGSAR
jgi:hypothetical protein